MLALIVFGSDYDMEPLGQVNFNCPQCGYTPTNLFLATRKATIYFIPLFNLGKSYALSCDNCGMQTELDEALGQQLHQAIESGAQVGRQAPASLPPLPA